MNKKLIALALVLLLAVGGLFAAISIPGNGNTDVTAILKATLGFYFYHGIIGDDLSFVGSKTINNAFSSTTPPSFQYGFETNGTGPYYIRMQVGNFINQTSGAEGAVVKIKNIIVSGTGFSKTWNNDTSSYTIYTVESGNSYTRATGSITVYPALLTTDNVDHRNVTIPAEETAANAPEGMYEATISFSVSAS